MSYRKVGDFSILGGKVYMGVDDEGRVGGFMMCPFQRDHFSLAMHGKNDWSFPYFVLTLVTYIHIPWSFPGSLARKISKMKV